MNKLFFFFILILMVGCQTAPYQRIESQDYSIALITRSIISVLPGGIRKVSSNRRELSSQYFKPGSEEDFNPDKARERYYVKVNIVGSERPYDIDVLVPIEKRYEGSFFEDDYSDSQALKYLKLIKEKLAEGREQRNVIDDFRAF